MYCKQCGREILEHNNFCPNCGTPVEPILSAAGGSFTNYPIHHARVYGQTTEDIVLGSITAILFGLSIIGGSIYALVKLTNYTKWIIPSSIFTIIGGISCLIKGSCQLRRLIKEKRRNKDV